MEARSVVVQLMEQDTNLSQEASARWTEIVATQTNHERMTTPAFDQFERLADELPTTKNGSKRRSPKELKERMLNFFEHFFGQDAPERRALSSRVFCHSLKEEYEEAQRKPGVLSTFSDMRYLKKFLSTYPVAPYLEGFQAQR